MTGIGIIIATVAAIGAIDAIMVWSLMKITAKENKYLDDLSEKEFDSKH